MLPPCRTAAPSALAICANSVTRRVLPTPASPATRVALLWPWAARRSAARRRPISSARPIRTGLETRTDMPSIIVPPGKGSPWTFVQRGSGHPAVAASPSGPSSGAGQLDEAAGDRLGEPTTPARAGVVGLLAGGVGEPLVRGLTE